MSHICIKASAVWKNKKIKKEKMEKKKEKKKKRKNDKEEKYFKVQSSLLVMSG